MRKIRPTQSELRERLLRYFNRFKDQETCEKVLYTLITTKQQTHTECPHCQSSSTVRFGKYRDRQRYKCKNCRRTFNDLTSTPLHYTHSPHKWIKFIHCLIERLTLAETSVEVQISYATAHYWRHKLIHALERLGNYPKNTQTAHTYPYICVRQQTPSFPGSVQERIEFGKWMKPFNWIARRFVNRFLAWFFFVRNIDGQHELESIQGMLISACSISISQTYETVKI